MLNILFIGCLYSDNQKIIFSKKCKKGYQFASQVFQESLIEGFGQQGIGVEVMAIPSLGTFPFSYKDPFVQSEVFEYKSVVLGKSIGFINLPFINRPSRRKMGEVCENWYNRQEDGQEKIVIVYGLHRHLMTAAVDLKKKHSDVNLCVIVPDLPEFMASNKLYKQLGLRERDINRIKQLQSHFDCFVLLSKYMVEKLEIGGKPYTVVEGIYNDVEILEQSNKKDKTIMYSGAMSERYGLIDLVKAFIMISDGDYRLLLCGAGDAVETIKEYCVEDSRIMYLGTVEHEKVLKLQKTATLLVNPRHSKEVFTRYSFPSKTMEYLASGTPVVMCPLQCIPEEYNEHLYFFDDESVEGMKEKLLQICEKDKKELERKGRVAREFILKNKNAEQQTRKIISLIVDNIHKYENSNS